jgi:hypothetical protein
MAMNWFVKTNCFIFWKRCGLLLLPVALFCIPVNWVLTNNSICIIKNVTGHECWGCGITRAIFCLLHGQWNEALAFNKLVLVVFPVLIYLWIKEWLK